MTRILLLFALGVSLVSAGGPAQEPQTNVSAARNPNIAEAQRLIRQAFDRISMAQQANHFDMEGHAKHAKELLQQADQELKVAAEIADRQGGQPRK